MKRKYVYRNFVPDQSIDFYSVHDAIISCGFESFDIRVKVKGDFEILYFKDGKYYICIDWVRYNTCYLRIRMREVERGYYEEF